MLNPIDYSIAGLRRSATRIFRAGVAAADPYHAVKRCLSVNGRNLTINLDLTDPALIRSKPWPAVHVIAFGKGACAMAQAAQETIPYSLWAGPGIAVTNEENARPVDHFKVLAASHPLPGQAGLEAAQLIADRIRQAKEDELVLILVSGGGSALLPLPIAPITLDDKIATTQLLLASGATINQVNCVRKHLSLIKGGGIARLAAPADLHAMILSDVLGDDLSAIASGPTVPDDSTFSDAVHILKAKGIWERVPQPVQDILILGLHGSIPETPKTGAPIFVNTSHTLVGSNSISVAAITQASREQGFETILYSDHLTGEAKDQADSLVLFAKQQLSLNHARPIAILGGGETTVTLTGTGKGGRNQEMALAFALAAKHHDLQGCWVFLSGGTDGRDGPTDAAGGLVDNTTLDRQHKAGIDPLARLSDNDAYHALQGSQDLLITGATGTNVADLQVLLITPHQR
ncbi:glycerate kinase [Methylicorpusculum sp.]|uniref:glycerate kinase type-2 family protein n=1 Tax=Methylicorpusculum sp. TaxID=2713644 RepID=UPI002720BFE1|nr:glycerate kinase [Methylicorpusculum sp.]MDO8844680.1 glycerate kinase [Methylicorpusculum sp.]